MLKRNMRKLPTVYTYTEYLNGTRDQFMYDFFQPLIDPDLDIGPPTTKSLEQFHVLNRYLPA